MDTRKQPGRGLRLLLRLQNVTPLVLQTAVLQRLSPRQIALMAPHTEPHRLRVLIQALPVELLAQTGADVASCIELSCRVHRGGGLGRELIYLSGYLRVAASLGREPGLERLLTHGRVSLAAARALHSSVELDDDGDVI